jgi:hypothetical protein
MPQYRLSLTGAALLAANLIPLLGVLFAGWSLLEVVTLYWLENLVIGAINILRMATCSPDAEHLRLARQVASSNAARSLKDAAENAAEATHVTAVGHHAMKLLFIPFFAVHYGIFWAVHGVFIFALLGDGGLFAFRVGPFGDLSSSVKTLLAGGLWLGLLGSIVSHLFSFFYYFLYRGEYRKTNVAVLMMAPYGRIFVLHVAILLGAFAIHLLGQPIILLLLLILGKTALDWSLHQAEHPMEITSYAGE